MRVIKKQDVIIGQKKLVEQIDQLLKSINEEYFFPSILLIGPAGTGKTTISKIIYKAINNLLPSKYISIPTGRMVDDPQLLKITLAKSGNKPTVFFLDEVHTMKPLVQETLYEPMDKRIITTFGQSVVSVNLPPLCFIAATTNPGEILGPFRSRFLELVMEPYQVEDIFGMLYNFNYDIPVKEEAIWEIAKRSKNNPRVASQNINMISRFITQNNYKTLTLKYVEEAFDMWGIDDLGFKEVDWRYLNYLYNTLEAQGIQNIAGSISIDSKYIENTIEPYLIQNGIIIRTKSGRRLTPEGVKLIAERT